MPPNQPDAPPAEGLKRCTHCGQAKPLSAFYWIPIRARYLATCKKCQRQANKDAAAARRRST
jgi:hypothetical protein